ncbi:MAG: YdbH domain-containing protein [Porticoccaceae bacterium]|jgi:hypothetical protein|nr:YdbH domain-containing protein [Porticoccaceae bacterium]
MRRLAVAVLVLALLVAALAAVATWQFSTLVTPQIARYLGRHGVESLETSAVRWRFNRLRLARVEASGAVDGHAFTLRLTNLDLGYQWWRLFNGSIDSVAIGRVDFHLALAPPGADSPPLDLDLAALLPAAWLGSLPVARLAVDTLAGQVVLPGGRPVALAGRGWRLAGDGLAASVQLRDGALADAVLLLDLQSQGRDPLTAGFGLSSGDRLVASGALTVAGAGEWLALSLQGTLAHAGLVAALADLRAAADPPLAIPAGWPDPLPPLAGESRLALDLRLPARLAGAPADWLARGALTGSVHQHLALAAWPDPGFDALEARLEYRLTAAAEGAEVVFSSPVHIEGRHRGLTLPAPLEGWRDGFPLSLDLGADGPLRVTEAGLTLAGASLAGTLGPDGEAVGIEATVGPLALGEQGARGEGELTLALRREGRPWLAPELAVEAVAEAGGWRFEGTFREPALTLTGSWRGEVEAAGDYRLDARGRAASLLPGLALAASLAPLPAAVELAAGQGEFRYRLDGTPGAAPAQRLRFTLAGMTGLLGGVAVEGASLAGGLAHRHRWQSPEDWRLQVPSLRAGVAVEGLDARLALLPSESLAAGRWAVRGLEAALFGGTLALAAPFEVDLPDPETAFTLVLSNWQLGQVAALYADHGLAGAGVLNGTLPVTLTGEGVAIAGGELASAPPGGTIAYGAGAEVGSGNAQLDMALRLLRNFHYDSLAARADFTTGGDLVLGLRLAGRNPDEFDGRAVNFNINVEENLFDLFKALRLTDEVINRLEKRLQR